MGKGEALKRLARKRAVSSVPPANVRAAFRKGLELYRAGHGGDGIESATVRDAEAIADGKPVTPHKIDKGYRFFKRNARFATFPDESPAGTAWWLWGASAGRAWFNKLYAEMRSGD